MRNAVFALLVCAAQVSVHAEIGPPVDVATRARGASRVVVARVADVQSTFGTNAFGDRLIVSNVTLEVEETLKGAPASVVEVTVEGGTVGDLTLKVSDMPSVTAGERAVLFLEETTRGGHQPHRRGQGILKLDAANRVVGTSVTLASIRDAVRTSGAPAGGRGGR